MRSRPSGHADSNVAVAESSRQNVGGSTKHNVASLAAIGFAASLLVVLGGSLAGAAQPDASTLWWSVPAVPVQPSLAVVPALFAYYGGLIVLVRAWFLFRRYHQSNPLTLGVVALVIVIWAVPLLLGPPLGSRDVYAYAAQGRMAEQGLDVYQQGPAELGADPILDAMDPLYLDAPVPYGPVFVSMASLASAITGGKVMAAVYVFRAMAVIGLMAAAVGVWDLARSLGRDPIDAIILAIANPLVLFHLVAGAHNEAIMLGFLVSGVAIGRRNNLHHLGIALCAFAAAVKLPAILAVAFLAWPWAIQAKDWVRRLGRLVLCGAEALAVIALSGSLTGWGWGWVNALVSNQPVDAYLSITRVTGGAISLLTGFNSDIVLQAARLSGLVVAASVTLVLLFRQHETWPTALGWSLVLWALMHPTTQPWYLTWGLLLLAATTAGERNRTFLTGCVLALFAVLPIGPQLGFVVLDATGLEQIAIACVALAVLTFSPGRHTPSRFRQNLDANTVTVVVPTRSEAPNIGPVVDQIVAAVDAAAPPASEENGRHGNAQYQGGWRGRSVEILFVDDSDDETPHVIEAHQRLLARSADEVTSRDQPPRVTVELLHRGPTERWGGLGGAVVDGMGIASGTVAVVMDGDLQHPADRIVDLLAAVDASTDISIASRRTAGGHDGDGLTLARRLLSLLGSGTAKLLFPIRIGRTSDPLSGFFAVDLRRIDLNRLRPEGFKILVEILATHPELAVSDVPFVFAGRLQGLSKASVSEGVRFGGHLVDVRIRQLKPWAGAPVDHLAMGRPQPEPARHR